jgi:hypothetical protein
LKEIRRWIAILAMLALVLTTLFTGIVAAAPEGDQPDAVEQSIEDPADTALEAPDSAEPAGDEPAEEEPASDEEIDAEAEDPVEAEEPEIIEGGEEESVLSDNETEETEIVVEVPEEEEEEAVPGLDGGLVTQLPQEVEVLCCPKGRICVIKFEDKNCNGRMDCGECGLGGVQITLTKGCSTWKKTTPSTGPNKGKVCFDDLQLGTYTVSEAGKDGYYATTATSTQVTLTECDKDETVYFGNARYLSICGSKFKDENCNGKWDRREDGLWGVTIVLSGEGVQLSKKTDWKGRYCFEGLKPGTYTLSEVVPCGYYQTYPECGSHMVTLECGEDACGIDFGNAPCGRILGMKWEDRDCSGGLSCGDRPMAGVEIQLWRDGELVDTAVTCKLGAYMFDTCLEPGTYTVKEVVPCGYYPSFPCGGAYTVNLCCGEWKMLCFFNAPAGSISGYKFWDKNCNGEWDDGEPPMEGVTICLNHGDNGAADSSGNGAGKCTQTDSSGWYGFENLPPGYYQVSEQPPQGFYPTTPNPVGVELCCGEDYGPVNFGNAKYGSICGYKFLDENGDGEWDEGEPGIPDVTVWLDDEESTVTDEDGHFCFEELLPGEYTVEVDESTVPPGHYASTPNLVVVDLACGEDAEVLFGNAPYGRITGTKYLDIDGDGEIDPTDKPMGGVTISLSEKGKVGALAVTTSAAVTGAFSFEALEAGTYIVEETLPEGYYQTGHASWEIYVGAGDDIEVVFLNAQHCSISGTKWNDVNRNGVDDAGESGIGGVTITLTGTTFTGVNVTMVATTNPDGSYAFPNLEGGNYTVAETVPGGMDATSPASKAVTLMPNQDLVVDFHNAAQVAGEVVAPTTDTGTGQLPATGWDQLPLLLIAGVLMLLGLMALMLGIVQMRRI